MLAPILAAVLTLSATATAQATSQTFVYTGVEQTFVVPEGITALDVSAVGGSGGAAAPGGAGGAAAQVSGVLNVSPGDTLYLEVGGNGAEDEPFSAGGFNGGGEGGGGGGGASDVRTSPRAAGLTPDTRVLVAAGGGGGGASGELSGGGGGAAGEAGQPGANQNFGGLAGTQSAGGPGGEGNCVSGSNGTEGTLGTGGNGGRCLASAEDFAGGGGGGGYYGGGGGGGANTFGGGGGGGGSNLVPPRGTITLVQSETAPKITISYPVTKPCPPRGHINVRWHYGAGGFPGSWSAPQSTNCETGSVEIGPQGTQDTLDVFPGQQLKTGYDLKIPGTFAPVTVLVSNPTVVFTVGCASGAKPSASTFAVTMATQTYPVTNSQWTPSGDPFSPVAYQGATSVPDLCKRAPLRLDKAGTFSATIGLL